MIANLHSAKPPTANRIRVFTSLWLITLLLATIGCQTLNPTREQQLDSLEDQELKAKSETPAGSVVSVLGTLLSYTFPFFPK